MRFSLCILTLAGVIALSLAPAAPGPAHAQEPAPFFIHFDKSLDFLADFGTITAVIGTTECGTLHFIADDWTLVVGGAGTPPICREEWRVVSLVPDPTKHAPLANSVVLHAGKQTTIVSIIPFPSMDGPGGPPFSILIMVDGVAVTAEDLTTLDSLTAYVSGIACGSVTLAPPEAGAFSLPVGAVETPEVCRTPGAEITLFAGAGQRLAVRPSIGPGPYHILTDLTLAAPGAGGAGSAGLAPTSEGSPALEISLALVTLALLFLARRLTATR